MLPAAQLKMLRYMQSSEPKGNTPDSDSGGNDGVDIGRSPRMAAAQTSPQRAQVPPPPLSSRQALAEAAKIPMPMPLRSATPGYQAASVSPKKQPPPWQTSYQHARSTSENDRPPAAVAKEQQQQQQQQQKQQQIWEESSINSMFTENITAMAKPQPREGNTNTGRIENPFLPPGAQPKYARAAGDTILEEEAAPLPAVFGRLPTDGARASEDPYVERRPPLYGSPAKPIPVLKHTKYALADGGRAATMPASPFSDRLARRNIDDGASGGSPEPRLHIRGASRGLAGVVGGGARRPAFRHVDAPLGGDGGARSEEGSDALSQGDETLHQRTPRPQPAPLSAAVVVPQKRALQGSSLPRINGGGGDKRSGHRRRHSPDYDDSALHSMSYTELKEEPFDHDPSRMAMQAAEAAASAPTPSKLTLEDRLAHYKNKETGQQHDFFTGMTMQEWDECGDWFLEQFAEVTNRIRAQRQAKRRKVAELEGEIAEREKMVRAKIDSIERTLGELKDEGEGMMRGKSVDL